MPIACSRMCRVAVGTVLGLLVGWGGLSGVAHAALITFNFEGNVTSVLNVSPYFNTGDKLVGSYSFNSDAPDLSPGAQFGTYQINQLSFTIGQNAYSTIIGSGTPQQIRITSNSSVAPSFPTDNYRVMSVGNGGPSAGLLLPREFWFDISGDNKFPNDSLPLTPPSLGNLLSRDRAFHMNFVQPVGVVGNVNGELTSLTIAPVPVPGAVLLFGSGLIGLAAFGRRHLTRSS
ncbi:MAG: VPLPA-CTERM sorting domain-containing protein [Nitrospira sp.]|nr:VPLPA-CTERM sorting domain-containing protein [Nitrospira sp.]